MSMNKSPNYVYDPKLDIEKLRLKEREKRTSLRRSSALEGISIPKTAKILDVGCGTGVLGFDLLGYSEEGSLVGIDIEPAILRVTMESAPTSFQCDFISGDAFSLPFVDGTFDIVGCQYVLQHINDPVSCLLEMRRVSRIGALAIAFEWDDGINFSYPPPPKELQCVLDAKIELIHRRGGDRYIGRKLYHLFSASGWNEIEVRIIHDIWQGPDDRKAVLRGTELSLTELKPQLIDEGLVTEAEFKKALGQMYDYYCGDIFSVAFFIAGFAKNIN